ncbi:glycosyltransferase family 2 protein [Lysobacter sp. HDW10]|uniref:glycosyltransferase family 2 protein n=1 Tax=Lysobacter sp. HDW10 TaxID=2714936 RepID=UPI00140D71E4|nr:glycosyltransferase family 2 protein [Lysobacter sp. HDW10]QIK80387.1 glycosyltransferase family 2 protein [Lysobacter sp. HDW10]
MSANGIAAIVVTYRSAETIALCIQALKASTNVAEIRVVDNGSDDGTMDVVQSFSARDPRIRFIANPDNPGFATACNQGASASSALWLAFVNPDLIVEPDSLARLVEASAQTAGGLVGAVLVDDKGQEDPAARRRALDLAGMLRHSALRDLSVPRSEAPLQRVEAVSGALMVMPRTTFNAVNGFDTDYRLHVEDLDLCRRIGEAGFEVVIANEVRVHHVRGVSSRSRPWFVEWHKHRGLWRYYRKFDLARQNVLTNCAVFALIWSRFAWVSVRIAVKN